MKNKITKKAIAILMLLTTILSSLSNIVFAKSVGNDAYLENKGDCGYHVQYWDEAHSRWSYIICTYVTHTEAGKEYPAYCLDRELHGVGEEHNYTVDLTKTLDDVRVWRTIINAYPYKTPAELGVENEYDAFVATKQAVYCILYNWDATSRYRGGDERGTKIANAIKNLVDIGRNGTQTPYTAGISTSKVGALKSDSEYYTQEFTTNCGANTRSYIITATNGMPSGAKITNMNNEETNTFDGNSNFKVKIPKTSMNADIDILFTIQASSKIYPIFYGKTRIDGTQNYAITTDPYGDIFGTGTLKVKTNTGKIKIVKNDVDTNQPIEGVTFQLTKKDGTVIANSTTNKNGEASFSNLYQGNYVLKEISTNDNYILSEKSFDVNVEYNQTNIQTITNEHKKGNIKVYKIDKDNKKVVLGNVEFKLYSEEFKKIIGTYYTDVNGELEIKNLRTGNYKLIETKTNKWYNLANDTEIKVEWDKETTKNIENELKKGQVKVIKVDKDNNEVKLEGVEFEVLDENDKVLEKIITDENGEALTSRYAIRDFAKLKLRETKTLDTYVLSDKVETIELKENQITNIKFVNERIKGKVEITKVDSKDENKKLEGAKFGLYDEKDNLIETLVTDKDGIATSQDLYKGKYYLKELETGSNYYLLNEDTFEFEIANNGETIKKTIKNEPTDITVDVDKTGTTEIKPCENVNYEFSNVANNSNVYLDNFKWYDYIPTDYIRLQKMTTGTWNQDLTYKVYYKTNKTDDYVLFKENLSTNENYDLDFTQITLADDEYITETMFDFGKVEKGFRESTSPTMNCKSFDTLKENDTFTNHTKSIGTYFGVTAEANSKWTTITHIPEEKHEVVLPRTGK